MRGEVIPVKYGNQTSRFDDEKSDSGVHFILGYQGEKDSNHFPPPTPALLSIFSRPLLEPSKREGAQDQRKRLLKKGREEFGRKNGGTLKPVCPRIDVAALDSCSL
jgi:hypothetical protein